MNQTFTDSPVKPVTMGEGLEISLNNFYDLLKTQAGSLNADEFLQLKLVADVVDISEAKKPQDKGYEWYSYLNLINRADVEIEPQPLSGTAMVGVARITNIYGKFLNTLSRFVILKELSPEDQKRKADLEGEIDSVTTQLNTLGELDYTNWKRYCELRGVNPGDTGRYGLWSDNFGHGLKIRELLTIRTQKNFEVIQIIDRKYSDADDQEIVDALVEFRKPSMQLCFPTVEDYRYLPTEISLQSLAGIYPPVSSGLYQARYFYKWGLGLNTIKTGVAGAIDFNFNRTTKDSSSITTDWSASGSVPFFFVNVKANVAEHKEISEEFKKTTELTIKAKAAFRVNVEYGAWFNANLFRSKYIKKHPELFVEFFGKSGSLLYYPMGLILIRGFSAEFKSTQAWTYNYKRSYSASAGGGFSVFGINFGGSQSYSENMSEHKIDQTGTSLKIGDDDATLRFVGYAVKKNEIITESIFAEFQALLK